MCLKNYILHIIYLHRVYGGETFGLQEIGLQYFKEFLLMFDETSSRLARSPTRVAKGPRRF